MGTSTEDGITGLSKETTDLFTKIFGSVEKDDLPQICKDTYTEVMNRFDKLQNKTSTADEKVKTDTK